MEQYTVTGMSCAACSSRVEKVCKASSSSRRTERIKRQVLWEDAFKMWTHAIGRKDGRAEQRLWGMEKLQMQQRRVWACRNTEHGSKE